MRLANAVLARGVLAAAVTIALSGAALAADPSGVWLSKTGKTRVKIAACGGGYCGTILAVVGGEQTDANNPDPGKRARPLAGVQMISEMRADGDGFKGRLYDYTSGKTYTGKMRVNGGSLELSGCVMGGMICKSENWSRAE